ncbi:unnamed protein product [Anisakis simplex]|uniref:Acetylcholine receptor subunit alpha-type acr-16 (inferred by orthology to a C. elegans protein) n=1 Tax=Anisakis simplex TaxID=6269 RepID=A0A0M3K0N1_ANISI|nr:unnamed protein product [Anisakis simplex]
MGLQRASFYRYCLIVQLLPLFLVHLLIVQASYHERRLYEDLMRDYNNLERPVANHSQPVIVRSLVYLKVSLQQIIDVDEKNQIVYVNAWLDFFGSWTYDGFKLDLQPGKGGFDISEYMPSGEWALPMTTVSRTEKFYECCPEPYPDLTFYLHMRRRTLYYGNTIQHGNNVNFTEITVLLSICFFLSIVSEISPPTSEAVPLLGNTLSFFIINSFSIAVSAIKILILRKSSGIFFSCCMIVVTASTVFTVYVLNLHYRTPETHEMGNMTRTLLLYWLPYILRMNRPGVYLTWQTLPPLFPCSKPKKHSESLIRNIKDVETASSRSNSLDVERRVHQYMSGLTNGTGAPMYTVLNGAPGAVSGAGPPLDIGQQATLLVLQRIYQELKVFLWFRLVDLVTSA